MLTVITPPPPNTHTHMIFLTFVSTSTYDGFVHTGNYFQSIGYHFKDLKSTVFKAKFAYLKQFFANNA